MSNKRIYVLLALLVLLQLFVPAKMIYDHESILSKGEKFKFKTAPIDPSDPFRGKYIVLRFDASRFYVTDKGPWYSNQEVYATLGNDKDGFAKINNVYRTKPESGVFLKTKVDYFQNYQESDSAFLNLDFSFNIFYMEESKAAPAEKAYIDAARDTTSVTYAKVSVLNGSAVISNVFIKDVPLVNF